MPTGWKNRPRWTAEDWKAYRRSKGIPPKADMPSNISLPHHIAAGKELALMMALPILDWPNDLFVEANKMAGGSFVSNKPLLNNICHQAACVTPHNNRVSATKTVNGVHHVRWFCCGTCQRKWYSGGAPL